MIGKFIPEHKLSKHKWFRMANQAVIQACVEPLLVQARLNNFPDDLREVIAQQFNLIEHAIRTEQISLPRKKKKEYKKLLSAKHNAYLLILQRWDILKEDKLQVPIGSQRELP